MCVLDKPSAPRNVRVTAVSKDSVSLAWDEPAEDGGAPVKRYVVEKADVKRGVYAEVGDAAPDKRQITATKLLEGNDYMFRVAAENDIGQGKPASLGEPITAKLPFGELVCHDLRSTPEQVRVLAATGGVVPSASGILLLPRNIWQMLTTGQ